MKKGQVYVKTYFTIRILVVFLYIGVIWYGFTARTNFSYGVIIAGMVAGLIINYFNYKVNFKGKIEQGDAGAKQGN